MLKYFYIGLAGLMGACATTNSREDQVQREDEKLVWFDDFDHFDESKWTPVIGDGCPDNCGFGNNELQYYTGRPENVKVEDGILKIIARPDTMGKKPYSSAKLISKNKGDWKYGRIEARAKLPVGKGTWAAIWMLPSNVENFQWPLDGEIDIMEHVGYNAGTVYGTIHTFKYNHIKGNQKSDSLLVTTMDEKFHLYGLEWSSDSLSWSVDGQRYFSLAKNGENYEGWPFDQPFHLILNLAVGGNWGGKMGVDATIWPEMMEIDYVKVYQKKE